MASRHIAILLYPLSTNESIARNKVKTTTLLIKTNQYSMMKSNITGSWLTAHDGYIHIGEVINHCKTASNCHGCVVMFTMQRFSVWNNT